MHLQQSERSASIRRRRIFWAGREPLVNSLYQLLFVRKSVTAKMIHQMREHVEVGGCQEWRIGWVVELVEASRMAA